MADPEMTADDAAVLLDWAISNGSRPTKYPGGTLRVVLIPGAGWDEPYLLVDGDIPTALEDATLARFGGRTLNRAEGSVYMQATQGFPEDATQRTFFLLEEPSGGESTVEASWIWDFQDHIVRGLSYDDSKETLRKVLAWRCALEQDEYWMEERSGLVFEKGAGPNYADGIGVYPLLGQLLVTEPGPDGAQVADLTVYPEALYETDELEEAINEFVTGIREDLVGADRTTIRTAINDSLDRWRPLQDAGVQFAPHEPEADFLLWQHGHEVDGIDELVQALQSEEIPHEMCKTPVENPRRNGLKAKLMR